MTVAELKTILRATDCAEHFGEFVFLCDPDWSEGERGALALAAAENSKVGNQKAKVTEGWLCIPTGGTSGAVRFVRHDEHTLSAAVSGFCQHFGMERVNAVDVLPGFHVSGLMARARCAATGGKHLVWRWKQLEAGELPVIPSTGEGEGWIISLVPTQLQRLLTVPKIVAWLRGFRTVLIGGGPVWPELANKAAQAELRLALSYGLTETAAMVAALRPEEFLAGARSCGFALPHARLALDEQGVVTVAGESVFRGYFPGTHGSREFTTEDLGNFDERGHLQILGRRDAVIITGGKKVNPADVEAMLRASGEFADVAVIGVPDPEWGERVVACYPALSRATKPNLVKAVALLTRYERPKEFVALSEWPRNAQGKINRAALLQAVRSRADYP